MTNEKLVQFSPLGLARWVERRRAGGFLESRAHYSRSEELMSCVRREPTNRRYGLTAMNVPVQITGGGRRKLRPKKRPNCPRFASPAHRSLVGLTRAASGGVPGCCRAYSGTDDDLYGSAADRPQGYTARAPTPRRVDSMHQWSAPARGGVSTSMSRQRLPLLLRPEPCCLALQTMLLRLLREGLQISQFTPSSSS